MIYRLYIAGGIGNKANAAMTIDAEPQISFLFDPANSDFAAFKQAINDDTAQLEDADGNVMDSATVIAFIKELP